MRARPQPIPCTSTVFVRRRITRARGRAYQFFEMLSDWLGVRVRAAVIGLGLGLVQVVSYAVCINHFIE